MKLKEAIRFIKLVKNPDVRGNDEKIEIAMIPIYETISNMGV